MVFPVALLPSLTLGGAGVVEAASISLSTLFSWTLLGGSLLYQALSSPKGVEGPRLTDFSLRNSEYGRFKTMTYGTMRVNGNIIWPNKKEILIREVSYEKYNIRMYDYYGTWAMALGDGACDHIVKIWLDNQLFFDLSGEDWLEFLRAKNLLQKKTGDFEEEIRLYTGAEDQLPDDYMESVDGVGNVPAYRGTPYILFRNIYLNDHFYRQIPGGSALVAHGGRFGITGWAELPVDNSHMANSVFVNSIAVSTNDGLFTFRTDGLLSGDKVHTSETGLHWIRQTRWAEGRNSIHPEKLSGAFQKDGRCYLIGTRQKESFLFTLDGTQKDKLIMTDPDHVLSHRVYDYTTNLFPRHQLAVGTHQGVVYAYGGKVPIPYTWKPHGAVNGHYQDLWRSDDGVHWTKVSAAGGAGFRSNATLLSDGNRFLLVGGQENESPTPAHNAVFQYNPSTGLFDILLTSDLTGRGQDNAQVLAACLFRDPATGDGIHSPGTPVFTALVRRVSDEAFLVYQSSDGVTWKPMTDLELAVQAVDQANKTFTVAGDRRGSVNNPGRFWIDGSTGNDGEYTLTNLAYDESNDQTVITVDQAIPDATPDGSIRHYPMVSDLSAAGFDRDNVPSLVSFHDELFLIGGPAQTRIFKTQTRFLQQDVSVADIFTDIARRVGVDASAIDVTELKTSMLTGHAIDSLTSAKANLLPLQRAFTTDIVNYDGISYVKKRSQRSPVMVPEIDLGARPQGSPRTNKIDISELPELDLPGRVDVTYHNVNNDFQPDTQSAARFVTRSKTVKNINLNVALTPAEARAVAEKLLWLAWAERTRCSISLPFRYSHIVPTDVLQLDVEGVSYTLFVNKVSNTGLVVQCQAMPERVEIYDAEPDPQPAASQKAVSVRKPGSYIFLLDIPDFRRVEDRDYGFWAVAAPSQSDVYWPGCQILRKNPDGQFQETAFLSRPSIIGFAESVLEAPVTTGVVDHRNHVDVELAYGADLLVSIPEDWMYADHHLAVLGNEIISFATVEDLGGNIRRLKTLLRGLYGTEWAVATHRVDERFALLERAVRVPLDANGLGVPFEYQVLTKGLQKNPDTTFFFTGEAVGKKPFSPVQIEAERVPGGDWKIQWLGRGRGLLQQYAGSGRPLIEGKEEYEIDFLQGSYPVLLVDVHLNAFLLAGDRVEAFAPEDILVTDSPGDSRFTLKNIYLQDGDTVIEVIETVGAMEPPFNLSRVLHTQEIGIAELDPNAKPQFILPAAGFDYTGAIGETVHQYGQDDIYGGPVSFLNIQIAQVAPQVKRGYPARASFMA